MIDSTASGILSDVGSALPNFGARLRRIRRLRGLKQASVADLAGVCQTTVSRWEAGIIEPDPAAARDILRKMTAVCSDESALQRLVESSTLCTHLVTDVDHRLLAASPGRASEWRRPATDLLGVSLWRFATQNIAAAEESLGVIGWWDDSAPAPVTVWTGRRDADDLRIVPSWMIWERVYLNDGTPARLCTSKRLTATRA